MSPPGPCYDNEPLSLAHDVPRRPGVPADALTKGRGFLRVRYVDRRATLIGRYEAVSNSLSCFLLHYRAFSNWLKVFFFVFHYKGSFNSLSCILFFFFTIQRSLFHYNCFLFHYIAHSITLSSILLHYTASSISLCVFDFSISSFMDHLFYLEEFSTFLYNVSNHKRFLFCVRSWS